MKKIIFLISILILNFSFGQVLKLNKANDYYSKLSYAYSAELYQQLIGSEFDGPELKSKLAYSYYKTGDLIRSESVYRQMILTEDATSKDFYTYSQVLKQNGKYEESDEWMNRFHKREASDYRGQLFSENKNYKKSLDKQSPLFEIKTVDFNSATSDFGGYISADGKSLYFISGRKNNAMIEREWAWNKSNLLDIYKSDIQADFKVSEVKKLKKLTTKLHEGPLCFSSNGTKVYYTRNNETKERDNNGIRNLKIYSADVNSDGSFSNESILPFCSTDYSVGHPSISKDGKTLYFSSDMPGSIGGADIWKVDVNTDGSYGTPVNLGKGINTEGDELFPWINSEGTLFYSSNGLMGYGGLDVYAVLSKDDKYSKPVNLGAPINGRSDDFAFVMSNDNKRGFFSSNRTGGLGSDDIYYFNQINPIKAGKSLKGGVKDLLTGEELENVQVLIADKNGKIIDSMEVNQSSFNLILPEIEEGLQLITNKDGYVRETKTIIVQPDKTDYEEEILLLPILKYHFIGEIKDKETNQALDDVKISIRDKSKSIVFESLKTNSNGKFSSSVIPYEYKDEVYYDFSLEKNGYVSKTISLVEVLQRNEKIEVSNNLFKMTKIELGKTDLNDVIQINPIYFDLNSSIIRPDAAAELDKVVKIMKENTGMVIELGSHTDSRSTDHYNLWLSDRRAKSSAAYIISKGIDATRITGKGYGKSKLKISDAEINKVSTEAEKEVLHQTNRRTEFIIVKMK